MTAFIKGSYPVTIAIAEDHPVFCNAIADAFKKHKQIELVGAAANGEELLQIVKAKKPRVVLTDIRMPVMDGIEATRQIIQQFPHTYVIMLSQHDAEYIIADALHAGARGFLLKNACIEEIIKTVITVPRPKMQYSDAIANKLLNIVRRRDYHLYRPENAVQFSEFENNVLQLTCEGMTAKEIAVNLAVETRMVESAKERIMKKTDTNNAQQMMMYAIKKGLFDIDLPMMVVTALLHFFSLVPEDILCVA